MGRFRADEIDRYGYTGQGTTASYFSLKNDQDTAKVRFLYNSVEDIEGYSVHEIQIDGKKRYVNCLRNYNDPVDVCPFCKNHMYAVPKLFIPLYNEDAGQVQVWERGKTFYQILAGTLSRVRNVPIVSQVFEIVRNGKAHSTSTTYGIYADGQPDNARVEDYELPKILGSKVLDKTAQDMEDYLHNGEFYDTPARNNSSASQMPIRRRSADYSNENAQLPRRTPAHREDVY